MTQRTARVDELIRQEIGEIIARDLADPRIGFVTITDVETTPDLSHARIWASFIGTAEERATALAALGHAMPFIRHELGKRIRIRRIPELHLQPDETLARGTRVLQLIHDLEVGVEPSDLVTTDDTLPTPVPRLRHEGDSLDVPEEPTVQMGRSGKRRSPGTQKRERAGGSGKAGANAVSRRRPTRQ
ncbi:MAG: 30S ribosome-binding factor RbfA [Chloroflexi bacterium]|nr:30S ribosome-binding factor RbfA [Chloroflexota bacterium]